MTAETPENEASWHSLKEDEVLQRLHTNRDGLSSEDAVRRRSLHGQNVIWEEKRRPAILIFAKQFYNPLILILFGATTLSYAVGEQLDAMIIIAIAFFATMVGFVQEFRSEKAIEALRKMTGSTALVIRQGQEMLVDARDLVPGDVIAVSVGDIIPADAYVLEAFDLEANEASLTGESSPVKKCPSVLDQSTVLADRKNILHTITTVTHGRGRAVVFATGMNTEIGRISGQLQQMEEGAPIFEKRMRHLGKVLSAVMIAVAFLISISGFLRGHEILEMVVWGISLSVAAVPEALPAVVTASLTIGMYALAKRNAIVRRLPIVETVGSVTAICCDKTGTLTEGRMAVRSVFLFDSPQMAAEPVDNSNKDLALAAKIGAVCNDAKKSPDGSLIGDPTETALIAFAERFGLDKRTVDGLAPRMSEIQFSSERKMMTTINSEKDGLFAYAKGAAEVVADRCAWILCRGDIRQMDASVRLNILQENDSMAKSGLRVLALAYKKLDGRTDEQNIERDLVFAGLVGMMDPPREGVRTAVAQCKTAGIRVLMITGDHALTAQSVAGQIGITGGPPMTGDDLERIILPELEKRLDTVSVFARVSPKHKIKIVQALKNKGHIVAMTGDGINDAPALKESDVGIAMGVSGTQVTKEASDIILADDNFASIEAAVRGGRRIMDNVKKYLVYLLPSNIGEIVLFASSVIMGLPLPLLAKHILYVNLVTDGPPAVALGMEPEEPDIMKRAPKDPKESVFKDTLKWFVGISAIIGVVSVLLFLHILDANSWTEEALLKARTVTFGFIVFAQLFFSLSCRSLNLSLRAVGILRNRMLLIALVCEAAFILAVMCVPYLMRMFDLVPLELHEWALMLLLAPSTLAYSEAAKYVARRRSAKAPPALGSHT